MNTQDPIYRYYRPAVFEHVGLTQPDMELVFLFDLPWHRGFPEQKLHIPIDDLSYETYPPGTILLRISDQLQQASKSAGILMSKKNMQALLSERAKVMNKGCATFYKIQ